MSKRIKDLLPEEVKKREKVLNKIITVFEKRGYLRVETPAFEEYEYLKKGLPQKLDEVAFKFFDHSGKMMVLRPDITTQIARVVATTLAEQKGPLRLYYSGDVYRAKNLAIGQDKQFHQVGIELFDLPGEKGDLEIRLIIEEVLSALGLQKFEIAETDAGSIKKLPLAEQAALAKQDFVSLKRLPNKAELIPIDIDYYTGSYFECYVPEVGHVLGSGGRYDNLTEMFGLSRTAVGFAFDLHYLMVALSLQKLV